MQYGGGYKLWCYLALATILFAFGCKQTKGGETPLPAPSNEITITVKGDDGLIVKTPNKVNAVKNDTWGKIKEKAIEKITKKDNFEIAEWKIKDANGTTLNDAYIFEKDETIFAVSKQKEEPVTDPVTITIEADSGYVFKEAKKPCTIEIEKGKTWASTKEKAEEKITLLEDFEKTGWKLGGKDGTPLIDETVFNKNETIFATSKRKVVKYKVEHWQENINNNEYSKVDKDTEEKTGEAGKNTDAKAKSYEGFTPQSFAQSLIKADGSTIVQIKYKRNTISLILDLAGGTTTTTLKDREDGKKLLEGKFEAKVEVKGLSKENHVFKQWEPALPPTFPSSSSTQVYTAVWTSKPNNPTGDDEVTHKVGDVSFKMKLIKAVTDVVLGDNDQNNNKEHKVSLSSYYIGETEVTQGLWQAVMGNNPSRFTSSLKNPVEKVSWFDCVSFCNKLTEKVMSKEDCVYTIEGTTVTADFSKKGFRLPTEAEWEYAAMGGEKSKYAGCNDENELKNYAWYSFNSENKTHEVGKKQANKYGLYDMSGNVWEWCWDWYSDSTPTEGKDPVGAVSGSYRVNRGGSWFYEASFCECAFRDDGEPSGGGNNRGLRLACRP